MTMGSTSAAARPMSMLVEAMAAVAAAPNPYPFIIAWKCEVVMKLVDEEGPWCGSVRLAGNQRSL